jgi:hypothetical protein
LAIRFHPDKQLPGEKQQAALQFQRISQAYSVLRDGKFHYFLFLFNLLILQSNYVAATISKYRLQ